MFIRRTQTRSSRSGEAYCTLRLVRSERVGPKVRQRTLLNLGRHFPIGQSAWPVLCRRIDEVLTGQLQLDPDCPPALEAHAQRIAAQLLARERAGAPAPAHAHDIQRVDVDSLELVRPRSVGVEHVALWAMDQLGLRTLFEELGVVSRFVSWDHREYLSEYSVDGLPGMTEQFGSRPEPAGLPFP